MNWLVLPFSDEPLTPHDLWSAWTLEPTVLIPLAVTVGIYLWGLHVVWQSAGVGHGITRRSLACFLGAILALFVALISPIDSLSGALFSAHMIQHLVLILIAAPLLVMSGFPVALVWALPRGWARPFGRAWNHAPAITRTWQAISSPVSAWLFFTLVFWAWHAPVLFEAALRNEAIHAVEHLIFLFSAMLFWWVLIKPSGPAYRRYGVAVPYLFATSMQSSILGALMTFTSLPWYPAYSALTPAWGFTPLQDQQLAGLIMWIPGGVVFTLLTIGYFAAWLQALEQRSGTFQKRDGKGTP